jgi:hypothetical protein
MPGVFISYRREDSAAYAGRLFDILSTEFGRENTFMDLDTIEGGDNFSVVIERKLDVSDALLAVIGPHWLTVTEPNGGRRLDNESDLVRVEIAKALERGIRVIPVLVGGATLPRPVDLPTKLQALCERQAMEVRDSHFHADVKDLTDRLCPEGGEPKAIHPCVSGRFSRGDRHVLAAGPAPGGSAARRRASGLRRCSHETSCAELGIGTAARPGVGGRNE